MFNGVLVYHNLRDASRQSSSYSSVEEHQLRSHPPTPEPAQRAHTRLPRIRATNASTGTEPSREGRHGTEEKPFTGKHALEALLHGMHVCMTCVRGMSPGSVTPAVAGYAPEYCVEYPLPHGHEDPGYLRAGSRQGSSDSAAVMYGAPLGDEGVHQRALERLRFVEGTVAALSSEAPPLLEPCTLAPGATDTEDTEAAAAGEGRRRKAHTPSYPVASRTCMVCLANFVSEEEVAELRCGHIFHYACAAQWLRAHDTCPYCRTEVQKRRHL